MFLYIGKKDVGLSHKTTETTHCPNLVSEYGYFGKYMFLKIGILSYIDSYMFSSQMCLHQWLLKLL